MKLFENKFCTLLEADDDAQPVAPLDDKQAMAQTLQSATPSDFDVQGGERQKRIDQEKINQVSKLKEWVLKIDEFINYLNGTEPNSIQVQLHSAPCETIFEDIARSEKKKISRLAAELSSLSESLKGYLISSNDR
jgi:hypothetical protein